jgi:vitamin B12 transporter
MHIAGARETDTQHYCIRKGRVGRGQCWSVALVLGLILGVGWAPDTQSQGRAPTEKVLEMEPVVVTATVAPTSLGHTTAPVTVISREQIEAQQVESVTELLRQVPGIHIDQAGSRGGTSSVYLRGSDPNFTVVMIDGIKLNDPTNSRGGSFDFSTLSTDSIERIEIVRGPLSAVYGSDAMGGVINIITRRGAGAPSSSVEGTAGRFDHYRALLQTGGTLGILDYAASGSYLDNGRAVEGDRFVGETVYANLGVRPTDGIELRWVLYYAHSRRKAFPDDSGGPEFAVLRMVEKRDGDELATGITLKHTPRPWWEYNLQLSLYHSQEDIDSPGVASGVRDPVGIPQNVTDNDFRRTDIIIRNVFSIARGVQFALGGEGLFEDGTSEGSLLLGQFTVPTNFALSRTILSPFFEVQLSLIPGLWVQGGVRVDFPREFDTEASPRVGVSYTLGATHTTFRVNWGEGFKLPSFFALSNPIVGNPNLLPETSRGVDVGVSQALWGQRVTVGVTYFYSAFTNLIDFEEGPPPRLVNRSRVTAQGVEMSLGARLWPSLSTTAHLTYLQTNIEGTTEPLRNRPKRRGGFAVQWYPRSDLDVSLHTVVVGKVPDSSIPTGARTLDAYARVDLAATWTMTKHWKFFLAINNIFNGAYEEFVGFPAPGISPRGGVRASF